VIFDFAGQESARRLWDFTATDMIFLLTDSTLKNIIASKSILSNISKDYPEIPIIVFANKQDTPNSLDPSAITKVMGSTAHAMVAIDIAYRDDLLEVLVQVLSDHFALGVPDIPVEQLLFVEDQ